MAARSTRDKYALPPHIFLYTLDQISDMLQIDATKVVHFDGRSPGVPRKDHLLARNIQPLGEVPEWRISEDEFIRWMRYTRTMPIRRQRVHG